MLITPHSNVKRVCKYMELAGKIIGVNRGKESVYCKETAKGIR